MCLLHSTMGVGHGTDAVIQLPSFFILFFTVAPSNAGWIVEQTETSHVSIHLMKMSGYWRIHQMEPLGTFLVRAISNVWGLSASLCRYHMLRCLHYIDP